MAEWRDFNASNKPDTCLWCGRKLRYKTLHDWGVGDANPTRSYKAEKGGDYQDGQFCGLRCGYLFGVRMAELGRRLKPWGGGEVNV
jgi:hypothetical protein